MKRRLLLTGAMAGLIWLAGCKGDDIIINTDGDEEKVLELDMPAINFSYTIAEALEDVDQEYFVVDDDGLVWLSYRQDVSVDWDELVQLNDINEHWSYGMSDLLLAPETSELKSSKTISYSEKVKLNHKDIVRYDSAHFTSGLINLDGRLPTGLTGTITLSIPETDPLISKSFTLDGINNFFSDAIQMENMDVLFGHGVDSSYVTLKIDAELNFIGLPAGNMEVELGISDMEPEYIFGYFGQQEAIQLNEGMVFEGIEEIREFDYFDLRDIRLSLNTDNSIGVPFKIEATDINFFKESSSVNPDWVLDVNGESRVTLDVAAATYGDPIIPGNGSIELNSDNSNILVIGNAFPERIECDIRAFSNPDGEVSGSPNFMARIDSLYANLFMEAPLWLRVDKYQRTDTIDFDFVDMMDDDRENAEKVEEITIYLDFYSKLPVELNANIYVADKDYIKIDDLLTDFQEVIASGTPDSNGRVTEPKHTAFKIDVTGEQMLDFFDKGGMYIMLQTRSSTYNEGSEYVKIYDDASFKVSLSFEGAGRVFSF
ncbi:hypothetical protein ACT3CD_14350 [Geofilum sp. OHC36d9]|uniref:hypothetical protein n=1 Tax=Geofilum sp. OHC36d9 TaxID=3458413 RepID=UPI004034B71A